LTNYLVSAIIESSELRRDEMEHLIEILPEIIQEAMHTISLFHECHIIETEVLESAISIVKVTVTFLKGI
jgi:hypothetical protein